jgi:hypothetical protein
MPEYWVWLAVPIVHGPTRLGPVTWSGQCWAEVTLLGHTRWPRTTRPGRGGRRVALVANDEHHRSGGGGEKAIHRGWGWSTGSLGTRSSLGPGGDNGGWAARARCDGEAPQLADVRRMMTTNYSGMGSAARALAQAINICFDGCALREADSTVSSVRQWRPMGNKSDHRVIVWGIPLKYVRCGCASCHREERREVRDLPNLQNSGNIFVWFSHLVNPWFAWI